MFKQTAIQTQTLTMNHNKNLCPHFTMHSCSELPCGTLLICIILRFLCTSCKNKLRLKKSFASILIPLKTMWPLGHPFLLIKWEGVSFQIIYNVINFMIETHSSISKTNRSPTSTIISLLCFPSLALTTWLILGEPQTGKPGSLLTQSLWEVVRISEWIKHTWFVNGRGDRKALGLCLYPCTGHFWRQS